MAYEQRCWMKDDESYHFARSFDGLAGKSTANNEFYYRQL
jgi:hypothetical protein